MRVGWVLSAWLLGASLTTAAPRPVPAVPGARAKVPEEETQAFAQGLLMVTAQVHEQYVRPVERADLLYAALTGLYEAARLPLPRDLRARLQKAEAVGRAQAARADSDTPPLPQGLVMAAADRELAAVLVKVREELAGSEYLEGQNLLLVACQSLVRSLDPYTAVVTARDQRHTTSMNETCDGVGLEVTAGPARVVIDTVLPGGPAQRAGLRPGDEITALDGRPVRDLTPEAVLARFHQVPEDGMLPPLPGAGPMPNSPAPEGVKLTVRRPGVKAPRTLTLERERFHPEAVLGVARNADNSWDWWADRGRRIAHLRLGPLAMGASGELRDVLASLRNQGLRGLVLDLRWCPGGYLKEATGAAELFLGECVVATRKDRASEEVFRSTKEGKFLDFPIVVLINGETSGGGELIAAALQDHRRARVAGQRSLGKASVQTQLPLGSGLGLKLTSGTFVRPSGKNLHRFPDSKPGDDWGVRPDPGLELRLSADLGRQLRQWWLWQTLRPGPSNEVLPLDDPEADPQRQLALAALVEQLDRKVRAKGD
jgi:C-terminal processing protease CtpA/Prc